VASQPFRRGRPTGGGTRALPGPLRGSLRPSGAGAHDQRPVTAQPGAEAADAGGAHLPQPGGAAAAGDPLGHGAERGVGQRTELPGHGTARGGVGASGDTRRPGRLTTTTTTTSVEAFYRNSRTCLADLPY
jgi:hypothetical protein